MEAILVFGLVGILMRVIVIMGRLPPGSAGAGRFA